MWTSKNCERYDRSNLRYPSDLTDDEWKLDTSVNGLFARDERILIGFGC